MSTPTKDKRTRSKPRPIAERDAHDPAVFCRCKLCDWQLIDGEGMTRTRPCCPAGLQFDIDHGLTLDGSGVWHE